MSSIPASDLVEETDKNDTMGNKMVENYLIQNIFIRISWTGGTESQKINVSNKRNHLA